MKVRAKHQLPEEKEKQLRKAIRLEWITLGFLFSIIVVMYLTMGQSQAMKTAWIEDLLSLIPPISFLIAMKIRRKEPSPSFPYGFKRIAMLSFLVAAVSILILGLYMLYDSSVSLLESHHPTLGHFTLFGSQWKIWSGWVMIIALIYSMIPPVVLGRKKLPLAQVLHEKTLHADASMNKADWLTALAAILGILGLGFGFWWADAVAAGFISLDVIKDGYTNVKRAIFDLMNHRPMEVSGKKPLHLDEKIKNHILLFSGIKDVGVRLHEEGHVITGEIFVVFAKDQEIAQQLEEISQKANQLDWRLHALIVMPVEKIEDANSELGNKPVSQ